MTTDLDNLDNLDNLNLDPKKEEKEEKPPYRPAPGTGSPLPNKDPKLRDKTNGT